MPILKPGPNEDKDKFVARCIKQLTKEDPNRKREQIIAICFQTWRDRKKSNFDGENMAEKKYKKDSDGHFIIAENVPFVFNSVISPLKEEEEDDKED